MFTRLRSAPKARLNASLRQRRRNKYVAKPSAEGAIQQRIMNRAFSASMRTTIPLLGRRPRLEISRAVGAKQTLTQRSSVSKTSE